MIERNHIASIVILLLIALKSIYFLLFVMMFSEKSFFVVYPDAVLNISIVVLNIAFLVYSVKDLVFFSKSSNYDIKYPAVYLLILVMIEKSYDESIVKTIPFLSTSYYQLTAVAIFVVSLIMRNKLRK